MIKNLLAALLLAQPAFAAQQKTTLPVTINLVTPTAANSGPQLQTPTFALPAGGGPGAAAAVLQPNAAGFIGLALPAASASAAPKAPQAGIPAIAASAIPGAKLPVPGAAAASADAKKQPTSAIAQAGAAASAKDGASFDGSKPGSPASELVALAGTNAEQAFNLAYPGNKSARMMANMGAQFNDFAAEMLMKQVFIPDVAGMNVAEDMLSPHHPLYTDFVDIAKKVVALAERQDSVGRSFAAALGRHYAEREFSMLGRSRSDWRLPEESLQGGEYWDLAAGPNAAGLMQTAHDGKTNLVFFDRSAFVISYLEHVRTTLEKTGRRPMSHIEIRQADLNAMARPAAAPKVIRWKNVHTYVDGFESRFIEMGGWLAEGGTMLVQNDHGWGQRNGIIEKLGPKIQALIKDGYAFDFDPLGTGDLESLRVTKPAANADAVKQKQASVKHMKRWEDYVRAVAKANEDERRGGMGFFFFGR